MADMCQTPNSVYTIIFFISVASFVQTPKEISNLQKFLGNPIDHCSENNVPSHIQID